MDSEVDNEIAKIDRAMEQEVGKLSIGTIQTLKNVALNRVTADEVRKIYDSALEDFNNTEQQDNERIKVIKK
jgi:ABC-type phosphate transport system substrate-binding protein